MKVLQVYQYYVMIVLNQNKMRKIFFVISFLIVSFVSFSQHTISTYAIQIGNWNYYYEEYYWEALKPCDIDFIVQGDVITANDIARSTYYLYDNFDINKSFASWNALDENNEECLISIVYKDNLTYLMVTYDAICFKYFFKL